MDEGIPGWPSCSPPASTSSSDWKSGIVCTTPICCFINSSNYMPKKWWGEVSIFDQHVIQNERHLAKRRHLSAIDFLFIKCLSAVMSATMCID